MIYGDDDPRGGDRCPMHGTLMWVCQCPPAMDDLDTLAVEEQVEEAVERLMVDGKNHLRFPWTALHELTGPLAPGTLTFVAARTGQGKTTFLLNVLNAFFEAGSRGWYMGLEQKPWELRTKWACLRLGIPQKVAIQGLWEEWPNGIELRKMARAELALQIQPDRKDIIWFDKATHVNRVGVVSACDQAADRGMQYVIIDHIDRVDHGAEGSHKEVGDTIRLCKELAGTHNLVVILASQMNRAMLQGDRLAAHFAPQAHQMRGSGTKEEEMDLGLGIWRPLKRDVSGDDMKAARAGTLAVSGVVEPFTMAINSMKDRADGSREGRECRLSLQAGKLVDAFPAMPYTLRSA